MRWFYKLPLRLRSLFRKGRVEQELTDELRFHLEKLIEENATGGMTPEEARYAALREIGGVEQIKEECRDMRRVNYLENFLQDVRYGLRQLRRSPGFTAVAVLTLALGIGANTAIFSAVNGILLEPLPYAGSSRLVIITEEHKNPNSVFFPAFPFSPSIRDIQSHCSAFERVAKYQGSTSGTSLGATILGGAMPASVTMARVSADFFPMLGTQPLLGRPILPADTQLGNDRVAVLNYRLWQDDFGGDSAIAGRRMILNDKPYVILGVMPREFDLGIRGKGAWIPLVNSPQSDSGLVVARLSKGVTLEEANAQLKTFSASLANNHPEFLEGNELVARSVKGDLVSRVGTNLLLLLGAVGFVLLIACVNVSALLVARAWTRQKEVAIRKALGATRLRIIRQFLSESGLLAVVGGAIGLLFSLWGIRFLRTIAPLYTPRREQIKLDGNVLWFTLGISVLAAILFGLAPSLQVSSRCMGSALKDGVGGSFASIATRQPHRLRGALVIVEVALAVVLVVGAALTLRSFEKLLHVDTGLRTDRVLTMHVHFGHSVCSYETPVKCELANEEILDGIRSLPGVELAAASLGFPMTGGYGISSLYVEGQQKNQLTSAFGENNPLTHTVTPDYFAALGMRLLKGRDFNSSDTRNSPPVAIVNQSFALLYLAGDPLGKRFSTSEDKNGHHKWIEVVGVVSDDRDMGLRTEPTPLCYRPAGQSDSGSDFIVRTTGDPMALAEAVQKQIWAVDKNAPISELATMDEVVARQTAGDRFQTALLGAFGALGLVLAVVGIYGVISYAVLQRTHEIGVRIALGAQPRDVLRVVINEGMLLASMGIALGVAGALALTRFLRSLLFEIKPTDPATFAAVAVVLTFVALLACYIPARRAMRVDPMVALRYE